MCAVILLLLEKCHLKLSNSLTLFLLFGDELACSLFLILGITVNPILEEIFCVVSLFEGIKFVLERVLSHRGKGKNVVPHDESELP